MIQYFPIVTGSLVVLGNVSVSGSINASGSVTISGSIASASYALSASNAATASSADNFLTRGTLTAQTIVVQTITSSIDWVTGSAKFGSVNTNTHEFTGSVSISGSATTALNVNAGTLFVSSSGRVGINTTGSINERLVVRQTTNNLSSVGFYTSASSGLSYGPLVQAGTTSADAALRIYDQTGVSPYLIVLGNGNVGIGTTNPQTKLHVSNSSSSVLFSQSGSAATIIGASADGTTSQELFLRGFPLTFTGNGGGGSEAMRITSGGNVGVGTATPTALLHVSSSAAASTIFRVDTATSNGTLFVSSSGKIGIGTTNADNSYQGLTIFGSDPSLRLKTNGVTGWTWIEFVNNSGTNNFSMGVNQTQPQFVIKAGAGMDSPNLMMNTSGNVGIGTSVASARLHVSGTTGGVFEVDGASAVTALYVSASGNVGIGTISPQSQTHIYTAGTAGNGYYEGALQVGGSSTTLGARLSYSSYNSGRVALVNLNNAGADASTIDFGFGIINSATGRPTSSIATITQAGLVGIGTTNPTSKLEIFNGASSSEVRNWITSTSGYSNYILDTDNNIDYRAQLVSFGTTAAGTLLGINRASGSFLAKSGGPLAVGTRDPQPIVFGTNEAEVMRITGSNVGIGTTNPTAKLHIDNAIGSDVIRISDAAGSVRFSIGQEASYQGNYINTRNIDFKLQTYLSGGSGGNIIFQTQNNGTSTVVERMRITSGGLLKFANSGSTYESSTTGVNEISTTANDTNTVFRNTATSLTGTRAGIDVFYTSVQPNNLSASFYEAADSSGGGRTLRFRVRSNGGIFNYQANNADISDIRTKTDIVPVGSYWDKFKAIEIVKYKYIDQTHDDYNIGVIAQQVESVAPEFIETEDGIHDLENFKSVYTKDLYHASIKVLQEAMAKIETLEAEIEILKNK